MSDLLFSKELAEIVARCWVDDLFKREFIADPYPIFATHGIDVPSGVKVIVLEDSATHTNMILANRKLPSELVVPQLPPQTN